MVRIVSRYPTGLLSYLRIFAILGEGRPRRAGRDRRRALDLPTGLRTEGRIYTAHKGDFYDITDGLWQRPDGINSV